MTTNEAAERLRSWAGPPNNLATLRQWIDEALATERRLTVERIRERTRAKWDKQQGHLALATYFAILDEVAGTGGGE